MQDTFDFTHIHTCSLDPVMVYSLLSSTFVLHTLTEFYHMV